MQNQINYFIKILNTVFSIYFEKESEYASIKDISRPSFEEFCSLLEYEELSFEEHIILLLALMPHISPSVLDMFFIKNNQFDRHYTEFGGFNGTSHSGFLPTGETAAFLLCMNDINKRKEIMHIFSNDHWFYKKNILRLEHQVEGEPFLSGKLCMSDEALAKLFKDGKYQPDYSASFPAKRITTPLNWEDLVLPYHLNQELKSVLTWMRYQEDIRSKWQLDRIIKSGYRILFYGPPGTGKTLTATLLGKQNDMDVYRVDLSMIVSKYIGETEKNLAKIFDRAEHQNWILFFDEADALFGQRSETQSSNDRHANQEVAYLLQRIEDFPGIVILATNLKENIDEAFFRRFQSSIHFPIPDQHMRVELWKKMIPKDWLDENNEDLIYEVAAYTLSGGSIVNVIQTCAIKLYEQEISKLNIDILKESIRKEEIKEGQITAN